MDENKWIYTSDRLPKIYEHVLCYYEYYSFESGTHSTYGVGYYIGGRNNWCGDISGERLKVIAWQPLPEPPEKR